MPFFKKHQFRSSEPITFLPGALRDVSDEKTPTQETREPEEKGRLSLHWICKIDLIIGIIAIIMMLFILFTAHIL
jgi:hypothetical protein